MALFDDKKPAILKRGGDSAAQLAALEALRGTLPPAAEKRLEADIRAVRAGIAGEERVLFELENSHMEMCVLQDLRLEHDGLAAQIDFLVVTPRRSFVLECKNLYGDVTVGERGDFVRTFNGRREGIYSPITQNQRHLELIRAMRRGNRNLAMNLIMDRDDADRFRSLVVLANPKTVLRDDRPDSGNKVEIVRADQLIAAMRAANDEKGPGRETLARSAMRARAEWFLSQHRESSVDYAARYRALRAEGAGVDTFSTPAAGQTVSCPRCGAPMVLRTARKGANAGKQFYGCSTFPKCRGIVQIEE